VTTERVSPHLPGYRAFGYGTAAAVVGGIVGVRLGLWWVDIYSADDMRVAMKRVRASPRASPLFLADDVRASSGCIAAPSPCTLPNRCRHVQRRVAVASLPSHTHTTATPTPAAATFDARSLARFVSRRGRLRGCRSQLVMPVKASMQEYFEPYSDWAKVREEWPAAQSADRESRSKRHLGGLLRVAATINRSRCVSSR